MNVFELYAKLGLDASEYEKGLDKAKSNGSSFSNGLKNAAKIGLTAITAATGAVTAFAKTSIDAGLSFDKSMSQVYATMADKADAIIETGEYAGQRASDALRDFAQVMGSTTQFTATEAADALNYMALAGYDAVTSIDMLPNVLNLAAAGNMDLARASDMVTDTQTAFGLTLERTTQMVDEMAKAASTGNTNVEQLGDAFLTVGGLAQELNGGFVTLDDGTEVAVDGIQELEIALTAMANAGVKGSEAGTHMRNMLLKLSSPTSDGAKALEAMGVAVFDTEGNMRSLSDVFGDLSDKLGEMTQEQKIQAIADLFNTRDLASAEALLNAVSEDWDAIGASIVDADGAAQKMAETQLDNLAGDVTKFKSALEGAQIAISDSLSPELRDFVQFGTKGISELTTAFKEGGLTGVMGKFGDLLSEGIGMALDKLPSFVEAGGELLGALFKGIVDNFPKLTGAIVEISKKLAEKLSDTESVRAFVDGISTMVNEISSSLVEIIPILLPALIEGIMTLITALLDNLPMIVEGSLKVIETLVDVLLNQGLPIILKALPDVISAIVYFITDNTADLISAVAFIIQVIAEALPTLINTLLPVIPELVLSIIEALIKCGPQLATAFLELLAVIFTVLPQILSQIWVEVPKIGMEIINVFKSKWPDLKQAGFDSISQFIQSMVGSRVFGKIKDNLGKIWDEIKENLKQMSDNAKTWGLDMISNFIDGILGAMSSVADAAKSVANTVKDFLGFSEPKYGPLSNFHTYAPDMMDLFAKGITENVDVVADALNESLNFTDDIIGMTNDAKYATMSAGTDMSKVEELLTRLVNKEVVQITADQRGIFNIVRRQDAEFYKANGRSALSY